MTDSRIEILAKVLVNYSLELKGGDEFCLQASPLAEPLSPAVFEEAILAGAHFSVLKKKRELGIFVIHMRRIFKLIVFHLYEKWLLKNTPPVSSYRHLTIPVSYPM